ncbi:WD40-repeat-containing domain protein [Pelagophyceae sp. CCMP2097]|nr:WD40-repeat-containing domain protein [Pelagophyceae sp. CCMP2097]
MFWSISVSASGETMCAGGSDRNVLVVDLAGGHATGLLAGHDDDVMLIAHNPRVEDELATLARKEAPPGGLSTTAGAAWSELIFFDASTCAQLARKSFEGFASDVRWSPRGDFVAMVLGSRCCVVDRRSLDVVFETDANFAEHARSLSCCAFQENPPPGAARLALAAGLDLFTAAVADGDAPERFTKFERGHVASITSVDWRAGFVVTGGMDEVILLYDATTAAVLRRIEVHVDTVKTVRFNTDCSWVLSGSEDRTARISTTGLLLGAPSKAAPPRKTSKKDSSKRSQVPSKRPASEAAPLRSFLLRGHSSGVQHVVDFSGARGGQIATCGDDGSVRLWDRDRALRQDTTPGPGSAVSASAWCDFGIIVADTRGDVHCYEVQARSQVVWKASLGAAASGHQAITSLSAAGAAVAVGMYKRLHLLAAADGSVLRSVAFADWVNICLLSPKRVVAAGDCEHVVVWAAGDLSEVFRLSHARAARTDSVLALAAFGDDDHVVAGGNDSRVHSYRGRAHAASASLADAGAGDWVCSLAFCERDVVAAATTGDAGSVVLLGTARPSSIDVLRRVRVGCTVAWVGVLDGDSRLLVTATASKLVQVWDRDSLELVAVFAAAARFGSPDGVGGQGALLKRRLAIGDESGQLYLLSIT